MGTGVSSTAAGRSEAASDDVGIGAHAGTVDMEPSEVADPTSLKWNGEISSDGRAGSGGSGGSGGGADVAARAGDGAGAGAAAGRGGSSRLNHDSSNSVGTIADRSWMVRRAHTRIDEPTNASALVSGEPLLAVGVQVACHVPTATQCSCGR